MTTILLLLTLFAFWLGLSGHYSLLFLALGVFSSLVVIGLKMRLSRTVPLRSAFLNRSHFYPLKVMKYFLWLVGQIILSNLVVARIILSPRLKISPHFVSVPINQRTLFGEVIFANSITLTPGTLSVQTIDKDSILVHALTAESGSLEGLTDMGARAAATEVKQHD